MKRAKLLGEKNNYGRLFENEGYKKRFEEILYENKICTVMYSKEIINSDTLVYSELTLVVLPNFSDVKKTSIAAKNIQYGKHSIIVYPPYISFDSECERIRFSDCIIADYYKSRNLIILYFNPFPFIPRVNVFKKSLQLIFDNINVEKCDNSEKIKDVELKKNSALFYKHMQKEIGTINENIIKYRANIEKKGREIITEHQRIRNSIVALNSLTTTLYNFTKDFSNKIKEIESLPLIEKVEFTSNGIRIDYGDIYIKHKDKNYYIGDFYVIIKPNEIRVYNKNNTCGTYQHPHVYNNKPCLGNTTKEFYDLLGRLELKKLIFLLGQYLRTYSPGGAYITITKWKVIKNTKK